MRYNNQRSLQYLILACGSLLVSFLILAQTVHAETRIDDGYMGVNTVWDRSGSPYIVEDSVVVPTGRSLTIEPGVSIIGPAHMNNNDLVRVDGSLYIKGQNQNPVIISGYGGLSISKDGWASISDAEVSISNGIQVFHGNLDLRNSDLSGAWRGIQIESGRVQISESKIHDNTYGLTIIQPSGPIFQVRNNDELRGMGGIGNALAQANLDQGVSSSTVTISNSAILDNSQASIQNLGTSTVYAANNWWGNSSGPSLSGPNMIIGPVIYSPWIDSDPASSTLCCSSVIFIPGLEGTRLYRPEGRLLKTTNQLWEPNRNADVTKLYLNNQGSSTDSTIYSGLPVGKALGLKDIYGSFMDYLNGFEESGQINEWKAFGYDWRKPIAEVVAGSEKKATTSESLVDVVNEVAGRSKTGQVTLIAHSNGGLVAKYLVKVLADMGKSNLVDKVISVAVPYLGTPAAIGGLLHGDGQSIAGGLITSAGVARGLGANMSSAYSLLPSREYFSKIFGPTIVFASTTITGVNDGSYPREIRNYSEQTNYIIDSQNSRNNPKTGDTDLPIRGNSNLMVAADILHGILDPFSWPTTIARWTLVGWNKETVRGLEYGEKTICKSFSCSTKVTHQSMKTEQGDGTVVAPSATYNAGTVVSLDLNNLSQTEKRDIAHGNMLGASSTETTIGNIISHNPAEDQTLLIDKISKIPGVAIGEPDYSRKSSFLELSIYSPVEMHVYDSSGRHTGIIPQPAGLDQDIEPGFLTFTETGIPGSSFYRIGGTDDDPEYQISIPDRKNETYSVVLRGTGFGNFTFDIDRRYEDGNVDSIEYANVPVTPLTVATTTVLGYERGHAGALLASTSAVRLSIDIDGNGTTDILATPETTYDDIDCLDYLERTFSAISRSNTRANVLAKKFSQLKSRFKGEKNSQQICHSAAWPTERPGHMDLKKINPKDRDRLFDMIQKFVGRFK